MDDGYRLADARLMIDDWIASGSECIDCYFDERSEDGTNLTSEARM